MAEILQIIPTHPGDRFCFANDGKISHCIPTCLALIKEGSKTSVVYMEVVDDEVVEVDTLDPGFLGFYNSEFGFREIQENFDKRKKANGESE